MLVATMCCALFVNVHSHSKLAASPGRQSLFDDSCVLYLKEPNCYLFSRYLYKCDRVT